MLYVVISKYENEIAIIYFQKMEVNVGKRSWYTDTNIIPETRGQYIAILFLHILINEI